MSNFAFPRPFRLRASIRAARRREERREKFFVEHPA